MPTAAEEMKQALKAAIEETTAKDRRGWHFDFNVNVALVITLLMTWGTSAWYLSKQDSRTTSLELTATQSAARV